MDKFQEKGYIEKESEGKSEESCSQVDTFAQVPPEYNGEILEQKVLIRMVIHEGETEAQAEDRLYNALYDGLCNNSEHLIDFEYI